MHQLPAVLAAAGPPGAAPAQDLTGLAGWVVDVVDALGAAGIGLLVAAENVFPPIPSSSRPRTCSRRSRAR